MITHKKIKTIFVIDSLEIGGANILTSDLINYLVSVNYEVSILSLGISNDESMLSLLNSDVKCIKLKLFEMKFINRLVVLKKIFNEYDIIHSCLENSNFYSTLTKYLFLKNMKLIITSHGRDAFYVKDKQLQKIIKNNNSSRSIFMMTTLQNHLLRYCDKFIAVSEDTKNYLIKERKVKANKIEVIYHGINLKKMEESSENVEYELPKKGESDFVIGYVGRLTYAKGLVDLLKAFINISENKDLKLVFVGDGILRNELIEIIERDKVSENCFITGYEKNVNYFYEYIDLIILPSTSEGLPLTLMEAMFHSKISLSTNVGGVKELISDNENGFIYNLGSGLLLTKIKYIIENFNNLDLIRSNARKTILEKFDFSKNVIKIEEVFLSVYAS